MAGRGAGESVVMTVVDAVSVRPPAPLTVTDTVYDPIESSEGCSTNVDALVVTRSVALSKQGWVPLMEHVHANSSDSSPSRSIEQLASASSGKARWRVLTPPAPPLTHATTSWRSAWRKMLAFDVSRSTPSIVTYASARNPYI